MDSVRAASTGENSYNENQCEKKYDGKLGTVCDQ